MIVGSVLLVVVAGVLLGFGLVRWDEPLLYSSIGVSGLSALALVVGVRRLAAVRAGQGAIAVVAGGASGRVGTPPVRVVQAVRAVGRATPRPTGRAVVESQADISATMVFDAAALAALDLDALAAAQAAEPPDEPAAEVVAERDAQRLGQLDADVLVVDARPRYHLDGCAHLRDREAEVLPVGEAVELGFTPCGLCGPAATLLRAAGE